MRFVFGFLFQSRITDRETKGFDTFRFIINILEYFKDICLWKRYWFGIYGVENKHN